jgi:hypothetical protein
MKDKTKSLDEILDNFNPGEGSNLTSAITIWLPDEIKDAYDRLQERTGRRFSKKVRELLQAAIEIAEARAS